MVCRCDFFIIFNWQTNYFSFIKSEFDSVVPKQLFHSVRSPLFAELVFFPHLKTEILISMLICTHLEQMAWKNSFNIQDGNVHFLRWNRSSCRKYEQNFSFFTMYDNRKKNQTKFYSVFFCVVVLLRNNDDDDDFCSTVMKRR